MSNRNSIVNNARLKFYENDYTGTSRAENEQDDREADELRFEERSKTELKRKGR